MLPLAFVLTVLSASEPAPTPGALELGERLLSRKQYALAEKQLRRAVEADPSSPRAHGDLALALLPQHKLAEAVVEGRLAAAFGPKTAEAHFIYGMTLAADGKPLEAIREYEQAVTLRPDEVGPLSSLAAAYAAADDGRASDTYARLIALRPTESRWRAEFADYLWRTEKAAEGNAVMEQAVAAFPSDADLMLRYGRALAQQERFVDAAATLEAARRLQSLDAATFALLAEMYRWANRPEDARATLVAATSAFADDASLQHALGRLWLADANVEAALPALARASKRRPGSAEIQLDYGRALDASGDLAGAEAAYRRATALSPNLPGAHYALGRLLQRQGRTEEASRELAAHHALYERARVIVAQAQVNGSATSLAWTELKEGRTADALSRFRALPESAESLRGQALALQRLGRHADALRALEQARALAPEDARLELLMATERSRAEASP